MKTRDRICEPKMSRLCSILIVIMTIALMMSAAVSAEEKSRQAAKPSDNRQIWMHAVVLSLSEEGARVIAEKGTLPPGGLQSLIDGKKAREIETLRFPVQNGLESYVFIGNKFPITYFDPKATVYQIIFVDVGIKFIVVPSIGEDDRVSFQIKSSIASTEDYKKEIERDTVFYYPSTMTSDFNQQSPRLMSGETVIISDSRGMLAEHFLKQASGKEEANVGARRLVFALTPHILPRRGNASEGKGPEYPSAIEAKTLCVSRALSKKLNESGRISDEALSAMIKSGEARLIGSQRLFSSGSEVALLLGRKYPLTYYDPRSGLYQVIYIDIGLRGKFQYTPTGPQRWNLKVEWEVANAGTSTLFGLRREQMPLQINYIRSNTGMELSRGESGIILDLHGDYYYKVIKEILFPGLPLQPDEELIFLVTVR